MLWEGGGGIPSINTSAMNAYLALVILSCCGVPLLMFYTRKMVSFPCCLTMVPDCLDTRVTK